MKARFRALIILLASFGFPMIAFAAPQTLRSLSDTLISIISLGTGILLTLAVVVYFWGLIVNLHKSQEGSWDTARGQMLWGLLAICVIFSIWGILGLLENAIFSTPSSSSIPGQGNEGLPNFTAESVSQTPGQGNVGIPQ